MVTVYLILITSLIASLCHFLLTVSEFQGVAAYTNYLSQIDRLLRRAFRFGYIQHESSIQQVIKDRDVRVWKSIMGTSSHPLEDLLPSRKNRALRGRSHPYQIPRVNTERLKKFFVNRRLFDSKQIVINTQTVVSLFIMDLVSFNVCLTP